MALNFNTGDVTSFINYLKDYDTIDKYGNAVTYADIYNEMIEYIEPFITSRKEDATRLLDFYNNRQKRVLALKNNLENKYEDNALDYTYKKFQDITQEYDETSATMNTMTASINYALNPEQKALIKYRKEYANLRNHIVDLGGDSFR